MKRQFQMLKLLDNAFFNGMLLVFLSILIVSCNDKPKLKNQAPEIESYTVDTTEVKNTIQKLSQEDIITALTKESKIQVDSIGILVYDGMFDLDAVGPRSVLSGLVGTKVFFIAENKGTVTSSSGLVITPAATIDQVKHLDILMVPGGAKGTVLTSNNKRILEWIKSIDKTSTYTMSVCTGAWILGAAGLIEGKKATTNWYRASEKLESYGAKFESKRWVKDGKYWTSAGVSAGIDMSIAVVAEIKGETYAKLVMLNLEYDPQPPFQGGSVEKTNPGLVEHMTIMYDALLK